MVRKPLPYIVILVVLLDQLTKLAVRIAKPDIQLLPFFGISATTNTGIAFGLLQGTNILLILATFLFFFLLYRFRKSFPDSIIYNIALGLIVGGAAGNLIDRIALGHVIDFLAFSFWPTFNLADSAITIGVIILCLPIKPKQCF